LLQPKEIAEFLEHESNLTVYLENESHDGHKTTWRFRELARPTGIEISLVFELGVMRSVLELDSLARNFVEPLRMAPLERWSEAMGSMSKTIDDSFDLEVRLRGELVENWDPSVVDGSFAIHGRAIPSSNLEQSAGLLIFASLCLLAHLLTEPRDEEVDESLFRLEGSSKIILSRKYERSPLNRALALKLHGFTCFGCGFNFELKYGSNGTGVIEIHHLTPVHLMTERRPVDPRTELVPMCSNCHTMSHRKNPPFSPGELREMIARVNTQTVPKPRK